MSYQQYQIEQVLNASPDTLQTVVMMKAATANGVKSMAVIYDPTANWLQGRFNYDKALAMLSRMCNEDTEVVAYQGATFSKRDSGLYQQSCVYYPAVKEFDAKGNLHVREIEDFKF